MTLNAIVVVDSRLVEAVTTTLLEVACKSRICPRARR